MKRKRVKKKPRQEKDKKELIELVCLIIATLTGVVSLIVTILK
jgi:uncharacterized membrane protein